ncbi:hypothetical protein K474DRAFT_1669392 [Panus rudis PR-1116 ss-1]|nr:hypothetical protein K474DRAFT_1669392 [Panus rudis PR-1116 ss-1]
MLLLGTNFEELEAAKWTLSSEAYTSTSHLKWCVFSAISKLPARQIDNNSKLGPGLRTCTPHANIMASHFDCARPPNNCQCGIRAMIATLTLTYHV